MLGERRIGHLGTLDPFATGLLVLLVGRVTRLAPYMAGEPKVYDAVVRFGAETATDDATGDVTLTRPLPAPGAVRAALPQLTGHIEQLPPAFSAKQVGGRRAHAAARAGRPLELKPVPVVVHDWTVHELDEAQARVTIRCGGGTYIRALARDLGRLVGSAAHLAALRRTASGPFVVADAVDGAALGADAPLVLRTPLDGLPHLPREVVDAGGRERLGRGMTVPASVGGNRAALVDEGGHLLAIAERADGDWQPRVVLLHG